jgi:SAM-dependent methyltransferase
VSPAPNACRFCGTELVHVFADLGMSPLANSYIAEEQLARMEPFFPLKALVCHECFLVQLEDYETPDAIFSDYAYFSSYSSSWLEHSRRYVEQMLERLSLGPGSQVVELASNDGYLLQFFRERGVPVLGVEPAANVAQVAVEKGIPTVVEFFGRESARGLAAERRADLLLGNNVLAHVPDLNDFVGGMKVLLAEGGTITMEFPHLQRLIDEHQFDTIYHEHFSYLSFTTVQRVFAAHGLALFDVEELSTHGGSLRIYAAHEEEGRALSTAAAELLERERAAGLTTLEPYLRFAESVVQSKLDMLSKLIELKREGRTIVGYGAPAKGNTLLNYCGIRSELIEYTTDLNPHKQGHYLPGTRIPIRAPDAIRETRPEYVLILPWNLKDEIMEQLAYVREWGGRFLARAPELTVFE